MKTNQQEIKTPSKQQLADVTLWVKSCTKPLLHFAMGKLASKKPPKFRLFSTTGVLVNEFTGSREYDLDLSAFSKGLYFIQIETETAQKQERIHLH